MATSKTVFVFACGIFRHFFAWSKTRSDDAYRSKDERIAAVIHVSNVRRTGVCRTIYDNATLRWPRGLAWHDGKWDINENVPGNNCCTGTLFVMNPSIRHQFSFLYFWAPRSCLP